MKQLDRFDKLSILCLVGIVVATVVVWLVFPFNAWSHLGTPVTLFIVCSIWARYLSNKQIKELEKYLDDYIQSPRLSPSHGNCYIRGKIVPISAWSKENAHIDKIAYWNLPNEIRAATHQEVGTVVWLDWKIDLQGQYENGYPWYAGHCDVTVIDFKSGIACGTAIARGKDLKEVIVEYNDGTPQVQQKGGWDVEIYKKINDWLLKLPRK